MNEPGKIENIGLFPLALVLFPESAIPLHIFEERYKMLISDCWETGQPLGINYQTKSTMSPVGCSAVVSDIIKTYDDGRMDILIAGKKRFRLLRFYEDEKPYFTADIKYFEDFDESFSLDLFSECLELFNSIARKIISVKVRPLAMKPEDSEMPSFTIAQKAGLTPNQKQTILEMDVEDLRLKYLISHLRALMPVVNEAEYITKVVKYDGYYNKKFFNG